MKKDCENDAYRSFESTSDASTEHEESFIEITN